MHLHAARGPPWRARVRPAGALGRPNQQEQHPKGPQATAEPEDRAGHPGFAAPQSGFYVAYTVHVHGNNYMKYESCYTALQSVLVSRDYVQLYIKISECRHCLSI